MCVYRVSLRFHLLDILEELTDERVVAVKAVTQGEEYLADHFPTFPVLPGVLMLEAATQAAAWLTFKRAGMLSGLKTPDEYTGPTIAVLKAARNVRYGHFVAPGRSLRVAVDYHKPLADDVHGFKVEGTVNTDAGTKTAFTGKLELACLRLGDRGHPDADQRVVESHLARFANLSSGVVALAAG